MIASRKYEISVVRNLARARVGGWVPNEHVWTSLDGLIQCELWLINSMIGCGLMGILLNRQANTTEKIPFQQLCVGGNIRFHIDLSVTLKRTKLYLLKEFIFKLYFKKSRKLITINYQWLKLTLFLYGHRDFSFEKRTTGPSIKVIMEYLKTVCKYTSPYILIFSVRVFFGLFWFC